MPQYIGSSTNLSGGGTYTSRWVLTDIYTAITGSVFSDQTGTLNVDQSGDGVNLDTTTSVAYTGGATTNNSYNVALTLPWVRLRYVNGATPQTTFRLYNRFVLGNMP